MLSEIGKEIIKSLSREVNQSTLEASFPNKPLQNPLNIIIPYSGSGVEDPHNSYARLR